MFSWTSQNLLLPVTIFGHVALMVWSTRRCGRCVSYCGPLLHRRSTRALRRRWRRHAIVIFIKLIVWKIFFSKWHRTFSVPLGERSVHCRMACCNASAILWRMGVVEDRWCAVDDVRLRRRRPLLGLPRTWLRLRWYVVRRWGNRVCVALHLWRRGIWSRVLIGQIEVGYCRRRV